MIRIGVLVQKDIVVARPKASDVPAIGAEVDNAPAFVDRPRCGRDEHVEPRGQQRGAQMSTGAYGGHAGFWKVLGKTLADDGVFAQ